MSLMFPGNIKREVLVMKKLMFLLVSALLFVGLLAGCNGVTTPGVGASLKTFQDDAGYFNLLVPNDVSLNDSRITDSSVFYWLKGDKNNVMMTLVNVSKDPNYQGVSNLSDFVQAILNAEQNFVQNLTIVEQPTAYKNGTRCKVTFSVNGKQQTTYHFDKKVGDNVYVDLEIRITEDITEGIFSQIVESLKVLKTL